MDDVRLIDANPIIKKLKNYYDALSPEIQSEVIRRDEVSSSIAELVNAPTISAQPVKRGRWIDSGISGTVSCSNCKFTDFFAKRDRVKLFTFCPGCGSCMDENINSISQYEAHWILYSDKPNEYNSMKYECSRCGAGDEFNINIDVPYCWKCGARMKPIHD